MDPFAALVLIVLSVVIGGIALVVFLLRYEPKFMKRNRMTYAEKVKDHRTGQMEIRLRQAAREKREREEGDAARREGLDQKRNERARQLAQKLADKPQEHVERQLGRLLNQDRLLAEKHLAALREQQVKEAEQNRAESELRD